MKKRIVVVEHRRAQAASIAGLLSPAGYHVDVARSGAESLELLTRSSGDLLLLGESDGPSNGLIEAVRGQCPHVPIVVLIASGGEDAAEALRRGAVSYLPYRRLDRDLTPTIEQILGFPRHRERRPLECCVEASARFVVGNDVEVIPSLIEHVDETLRAMNFGTTDVRIRIKVALTEAVTNAMLHGNLELDSELREGDGAAWDRLMRQRRRTAPYHDRRVVIDYRFDADAVEFRVEDDGPGFDPRRLPDPTRKDSLARPSGRGVLLMRSFMHEVRYNGRGNEVTMIRRAR